MSQSVRVVRMPKIKYRMVSLLISLVRMGGMVWFGPFILVLFDFLGDCNGAALIAVGGTGSREGVRSALDSAALHLALGLAPYEKSQKQLYFCASTT